MKRAFAFGFLAILVVIQFIRPERNEGAAETDIDVTHFVDVPNNVMTILQSSCYDCYSNRTEYPWYAEINPVGW